MSISRKKGKKKQMNNHHDSSPLLAATPSASSKKRIFGQDRRKTLAILALVAVVVPATAFYFSTKRTNHFASLEDRVNTESNVNLAVPNDWVPVRHTDGHLEYLPAEETDEDHGGTNSSDTAGDTHAGLGAQARVLVTPQGEVASDWPDLSDEAKMSLIDTILKDSEAGKFNFGFVNASTTTINGIYGILGETIETNSHYTTDMRGLAFVSINPEGKLYKVAAIVPESDFSANRSAMQKIIESFNYAQKKTEN